MIFRAQGGCREGQKSVSLREAKVQRDGAENHQFGERAAGSESW